MSTTESELRLKQNLSLLNGITMIIGNIIGSGIFVSPTGVHREVGSVAMSLIVWAVSGLISLVGAICYAELGTTIVRSGASYSYIKEAFGPMFGFVRVWLSILIIEPSSQAAIAITFADYMIKSFFPTCEAPFMAVRLIAACCCLFIVAMNCISVNISTKIQNLFSYGKVLALIIIIVTGLYRIAVDGLEAGSLSEPWQGSNFNAGPLAMAMYSGLYSYAGWDTLNFMVEELKNPYTNLPRALYISLPLCTVVYLLTNVAYYAVLTPQEITEAPSVALVFAEKTLGSFSPIIVLFVAISCFGALNSCFYASSRLFYVASREGQLPKSFAMVSPEQLTPIPSLILTGSLTLVFLCFENIFDLINLYSFMYWLTIGMAVAGMILLRFKRPEMPRPIQFHLSLPIMFALVCLYLVIIPFATDTRNSLIGAALLITGFPAYFYFVHDEGRFKHRILAKMDNLFTRFLQSLFVVLPETCSTKVDTQSATAESPSHDGL